MEATTFVSKENLEQFGSKIKERLVKITSDKTFVHESLGNESVWRISHNLDKIPEVMVVDENGNGDVDYKAIIIDSNTILLDFGKVVNGVAYVF